MTQDCPICFEPISSPWGVCSPCGHPLHDDCRRDLLNSGIGRQCPLCNCRVESFVKVYLDVDDSDPEQIQQLEAAVTECKEKSDYYMAQMIAREEDVCNLKDQLEMNEDRLSAKNERIRLLTKELNDKAVEVVKAVSNAQHFISKLSAHDGEIRELKAKVGETKTVIEDLRSDLQCSLSSHKRTICQVARKLRDKDVEVEKIRSSAARTHAQMNAQNKAIRLWKHGVILALGFLFSMLKSTMEAKNELGSQS